MKLTKRRLSIITLAAVCLLSLAVFFGIFTFRTAEAAGTVTVSGTNVFNASDDAKVAGAAVGEGDDAKYYSTFTLSSDDAVISYRRNVAYNWFEQVTTGEGDDAVTNVVNGQFSLEIGFKNTAFEKFVITFESQQYNKTKDGKTKNYVMFFPASAGKVYAVITSDEEAELKDEDKKVELDAGNIYLEFKGKYTEDFTGGYNITVRNENGGEVNGKLENVGGNFARYSGSSTSPVYPLIFTAKFAEDAETKNAEMVLYSFNGQSFETTSSTSNTVKDERAPVLCLGEEFSYLNLNGELDLEYTVIDVLRNSPPTPTLYYYLLTYDQYKDEKITDFNDKDLFLETKSMNDVLLEADKGKYMPTEADLEGTAFGASYINKDGSMIPNPDKDKPVADMLARIYLKLTDSSSNGETSEVYLDWYMNDEYLVTLDKDEKSPFIAVAKDSRGITYNYGDNWESIKEAYQAKVTEVTKNLSAGSSSYMYLPSPESLFSDNVTAYSDMKFSIYYYHDSKQSNTNLSSSNLSINITKQGKYTFTIFATDAAGNDMYYLDENGEVKEFKASDIWNMFDDKNKEGLYDKLPWFTFDVGYKGVEFEEVPGMQTTAYVGTLYNSASFKINGISGSYTTKYRLFVFDSAKYYRENNNATFTYQEFIDKMDELFENPLTRVYFEEILQVSEGDADYEKYKDYGWNNTSTSFTPQDEDSYYYMRAEVKDKQYLTDPVTCSLAIAATENAKTLKGQSDWLKNNVASVVLLVIAGVAAIGVVVLFFVKPKDKGDVDVQLEKPNKKKK